MRTNWRMKSYDLKKAEELKKSLEISDLLARMLTIRGICSPEDAREFLYQDSLEALTSPFLFSGMKLLVNRVREAVDSQEKILVYGDYDVDGICSVVILTECLQFLGANVDYRVPDRFSEGYGLNCNAIREIAEKGYTVIITVDCGITSLEEAALCKELGIDLLVTDHHTPGNEIPDAYAVINPKLDNHEKIMYLCGAGVALKAALALTENLEFPELIDEWIILAALATIADVVPLIHENRIIVKRGLAGINQTKRFGLIKILQNENLWNNPVTTGKLAFQIIPKLNSAGRLETANISIEALLTMDEEKAEENINRLLELNVRRRQIEDEIFQLALQEVSDHPEILEKPLLIVQGQGWNHGIVGILASRLVSCYHKPTLVITWDGNTGKGSGRSIEGISLYDILVTGKSYLQRFGGHKMAAGLTVMKKDFDAFYQVIMEKAEEISREIPFEQTFYIDAELSESQILSEGLDCINLLEPTGEGNPMPYFLLRGVSADFYKRIGKNKEHLLIKAGNIDAIAFQQAQYLGKAQNFICQDFVFTLSENEFMGVKRLQLVVQEFFPTPGFPAKNGKTATLLEKRMQDIAHSLNLGENVLFLYDDIRSMQKHSTVLKFYFKNSTLLVLHGRLPEEEFIRIERDIQHTNGKIILMTRAAFAKWKSDYSVPATVCTAFLCWNRSCNDLELPKGMKVFIWDDEARPVKVLAEDSHGKERGMVYVNLPSSVSDVKKKYPDFLEDVQLSYDQRLLIREKCGQGTEILITDGTWVDNSVNLCPEWIEFYDVPYTYAEIADISRISYECRIPVYYSFKESDRIKAEQLIERLYFPSPDLLSEIFSLLSEAFLKDKVYNVQLEKLLQYLQGKCKFSLMGAQLDGMMRIYEDVKLCEYYKKGSILTIRLLSRRDVRSVNWNDSLYYNEGLESRLAFEYAMTQLINISEKRVAD